MAHLNDTWAAGNLYESYVGRWSRRVAHALLEWLRVPADSTWLDVGCGTGALTGVILEKAAPASVVGIDPSDGFVGYARQHTTDLRAWFEQGDAQKLSFESRRFDAAVSALVLNFVLQPHLAVAEMARVVRPGGTVAAYVWDYAEGMQLMRYFWDAAIALDPAAVELDEARRFPLCQPARLEALFAEAGLDAVEEQAIRIETTFKDFDDYWTPFLGGQGPAPGYAMALKEADRAALRERIRADLPHAADGTIQLTARAWAVRGLARAP